MAWQRLSVRAGQEPPDDEPYEGIPDHMRAPLAHWLRSRFKVQGRLDIEFMLKIANSARIRLSLDHKDGEHRYLEILNLCDSDPNVFLDIIDGTIHAMNIIIPEGLSEHPTSIQLLDFPIYELKEILEVGGSAWTVADDGKALERLVDPTVKQAARMTMKPQDASSEELRQAWRAGYGRNPNPSDAWDHAIKAIEAMLIPLVVPTQARPTLGHVVGQLNSDGANWKLVLPGKDQNYDIAPLISMLNLLWPNPDRHANRNSREPTLKEARATLHLAITIVQWAREGIITRR